MSTLVIIGSARAKPGKAKDVRPILKSLLIPTLAEEGCLSYEPLRLRRRPRHEPTLRVASSASTIHFLIIASCSPLGTSASAR